MDQKYSQIIVRSVLDNPVSSYCYENAFRMLLEMAMSSKDGDNLSEFISGSAAELEFVPPITCIGDLDFMYYRKDFIATFDDHIDIHAITNCTEKIEILKIQTLEKVRGYVHLDYSGECVFNWQREIYEYRRNSNEPKYSLMNEYFKQEGDDVTNISGPALVTSTAHIFAQPRILTIDRVFSVKCLGWPPMAQSWLIRERKNGWPDAEMVSEVKQGGCDLVPVAHRDHKNDKLQWRISFSRAEIILIRSWTVIQKVVYHMLRYFAKQQLIKKEWRNGNEIICNYHLKTLMLWACEEKSSDWWNSNCVIEICSQLLQTMVLWLAKKQCPHYFIEEWNLFDFEMKQSRFEETKSFLNYISERQNLTEWFRLKYILELCKQCDQENVLNSGIITGVDGNVDYEALRKIMTKKNEYFSTAFNNNAVLFHYSYDRWNRKRFVEHLLSVNYQSETKQTLDYAFAVLRLAWNLSCRGAMELSNADILDLMSSILFTLSDNKKTMYLQSNIPFKVCAEWYFCKRKDLLSATYTTDSVNYFLWMKTCKRFFKSALGGQDKISIHTFIMSKVYLSALYYISKCQRDKAVCHCSEALHRIIHSNEGNPSDIECSTLLFVDEVSHVCGFGLLYNYVVKSRTAQPVINTSKISITCFLSSLILFQKWDINECNRISQTKIVSCQFQIPFDFCLHAVCQHNYDNRRYMMDLSKCPDRDSNIPKSLGTYVDLLVDLSIDMFKKVHLSEYNSIQNILKWYHPAMFSVYDALSQYRKHNYKSVIDICTYIILMQATYEPPVTMEKSFIAKSILGMYRISVLFAFQTLFGSEILVLTELIGFIDPGYFDLKQGQDIAKEKINESSQYTPDFSSSSIQSFCTEKSPWQIEKTDKRKWPSVWASLSLIFAVFYLRCECLSKGKFSKADVVQALRLLKNARTGLLFEDILFMFMVRKLKLSVFSAKDTRRDYHFKLSTMSSD